MSKLSLVEEVITGKKEDYYVNRCNAQSRVGRSYSKNGYKNVYEVDGHEVVLTFNQYANGEDYDDELVDVEIKNIMPF